MGRRRRFYETKLALCPQGRGCRETEEEESRVALNPEFDAPRCTEGLGDIWIHNWTGVPNRRRLECGTRQHVTEDKNGAQDESHLTT